MSSRPENERWQPTGRVTVDPGSLLDPRRRSRLQPVKTRSHFSKRCTPDCIASYGEARRRERNWSPTFLRKGVLLADGACGP
jgi:hypothetical protein